MEYEEHEKRAWSVDFSRTDPSMLVSGSDDCKVIQNILLKFMTISPWLAYVISGAFPIWLIQFLLNYK